VSNFVKLQIFYHLFVILTSLISKLACLHSQRVHHPCLYSKIWFF